MSLMVIDELVEKEELTKLWNINCRDITQLIQDFISNSVNDAGAEGVVIGLSGGIDSTVAVYLAAKALPSEKIYKQCLFFAKIVHDELGCKGISRSDFLFDEKNIYFLEINTQPGLTPISLVPEQLSHNNIDFDTLIKKIIESSL